MKKVSIICSVIFSVCLVSSLYAYEVRMNGNISGSKGIKITSGLVYTINFKTPWDSTNVSEINNGKFQISINGTENDLYSIYFDIPNYHKLEIPFIIEKIENYQCNINISENQQGNSQIKFSHPNSATTKLISLYLPFREKCEEIAFLFSEFIKVNNWQDFSYDVTEEITKILSLLNTEEEPLIRDILYFFYFDLAYYNKPEGIDEAICTSAINEISPLSPIWSLDHNTSKLNFIVKDYENFLKIRKNIVSNHPHLNVRAEILYDDLRHAKSYNKAELYSASYNQLVNELYQTNLGQHVKQNYKPTLADFQIEKGKSIPSFRFISIDDSMKILTSEELTGKVFLLDFWATWCIPCVAEIPNFQKVYTDFKDKGFEIISISFDNNLAIIQQFRKQKYELPWFNTIIPEKQQKEIRYTFEIAGFPTLILVDAKGAILAKTGDLAQGRLEKKLRSIFN